MIYTIEEIKEKINPILKKYEVKEAYLYGSYARGEATEHSDIDLAINEVGSLVENDFFTLRCKLRRGIDKELGIIKLSSVGTPLFTGDTFHCKRFKENFERDKVSLL